MNHLPTQNVFMKCDSFLNERIKNALILNRKITQDVIICDMRGIESSTAH